MKINNRSTISTAILIAAGMLLSAPAYAQVTLTPIIKNLRTVEHSHARTKDLDPLPLPFWDDFSFTTTSFPIDTLWEHSRSVTIGDGLAINPPSVRVASFNGMDSTNTPYRPNEPDSKGLADKLTSVKIDLSESAGNPVTLGERNSVFLSFFYQWKGNGEAPDNTDYLQVEFKNASGKWNVVKTIYGSEALSASEFYTEILPVSGDEYFHSQFQFRFQSYGRLNGPFDTWNVDYVYLNKGRDVNDLNFPDQAIMSPLTPLFGRYRSMPIWHYQNSLSGPSFGLSNLKSDYINGMSPEEPIKYSIEGTFINHFEDGSSTQTTKPISTEISISDLTLKALEKHIETLTTIPDINDTDLFNPLAVAIDLTLKVIAITGDFINSEGEPATDYTPAKYAPITFQSNDTTSSSYHLEDYFAYDDGIAEYAARLNSSGDRMGVRFDMPEAADTLVGFYVYFPHIAGNNSQTLDFYVYEDDGAGKPKALPLRTFFSKTVNKNGSHTFDLVSVEPVVVQSPFYIAYKEPVAGNLDIGLDKDYDNGDKIYYFVDGSWQQNTLIKGSMMIRARLGKGTGTVTGLPEEAASTAVHPNPNKGTFYINTLIRDLKIWDISGKPVHFTTEPAGSVEKVMLTSPSKGVYLVKWKSQDNVFVKKIMVVSE